jgi:nitroreductase
MNINFNVEESIKQRVSVRNYSSIPISEKLFNSILDFTQELNNPFNVKVNYHFLDLKVDDESQKLGTYGVIKGAQHYIGATTFLEPYSLEALGYEMEILILYLTHLGLGTCWLGGTFNRKGFVKGLNIEDHEILPIITPFGFAQANRHITEIAMRKIIKADQRKPWDQLFFLSDFDTPLTPEKAEEYANVFEMVRLAPSASNKQPWRIILINHVFHFFEYKEPGYSNVFPYDIQRIDMGIAASHFELAMHELDFNGVFNTQLNPFTQLPENTHYSFSWVRSVLL